MTNQSMTDHYVHLYLHNTMFPNNSLSAFWYKDQIRIKAVHISQCGALTIEADAFNVDPLKDIKEFSAAFLISIQFEIGALNGLRNLESFYMNRIPIKKMYYKLFEPVAETLQYVTVRESKIVDEIFNMVGACYLRNLMKVFFDQIDSVKLITPNTISQTPAIETVYIQSCGVEAILEGSFEYVKDTLFALILRGNKLKTLPSRLLDNLGIYLDKSFFNDNPWQCDCDLFVIHNSFNSFDVGCRNQKWSSERFNCANRGQVEAAAPTSRCFTQYGTNSLRITFSASLEFKFVFGESVLSVKNSQRTIFYMLIRTKSKARTICVSTTAKYAVYSLEKLQMMNGIHTVCAVINKMDQQIWPRNCVSFTRDLSTWWIDESNGTIYLIAFNLMLVLVFAVGIAMAAIVIIKYPNMLKGIDNVIFLQNPKSGSVQQVFVVPKTWTTFQKMRWIRSMEPTLNTNSRILKRRSTFSLSGMSSGLSYRSDTDLCFKEYISSCYEATGTVGNTYEAVDINDI